MPYEHKKTGKNEVTVSKKDSGKVVGHTSPGKLNDYLAALHIHSGDNAAGGGVVEIPKSEFIEEHENLIPKLEGAEKTKQSKELKEVRGYAMGGQVGYDEEALKKHLTEKYNQPQVSYTPPQMATGGVVGPYPSNRQMVEETNEDRHPESEDREFMADGGIAGGQFGEDELKRAFPFAQQAEPAPVFNPRAGMPPAPAAPAPAVAPTPGTEATRPLPGNPGVSSYIADQQAQIAKYGPEAQLGMQRAIQEKQAGLGPNLARAGGTFADALMQGVARAGNPGFGAGIAAQQEKAGEQQLGAFQKAGEQSLQQISAQQKLDAINPKSELSKSVQQTYAPLLKKMGFQDQMIGGMSAQNISDLTGKAVDVLKAEAEKEMARASLDLRSREATATAAHQKATEEQAKEGSKLEATKTLAAHPFTSWLPTAANKALKAEAGLGAPTKFDQDVLDYAAKHGISAEQAQNVKLHRPGGQ